MIPGNANPLLLASAADGAAAAAGPTRSLRFNASDSAYLSRTPSGGNRKKFTMSFWYKPALQDTSNRRVILEARNTSGHHSVINFRDSDDKLEIYHYDGSLQFQVLTSATFRDPSAWYSFVIAYNTEASGSDKIKIFCNGARITAFDAANYPSDNYEALWNDNNVPHTIGKHDSSKYLSGYLADIYFIDGSQLDATSFGAYDDNGVWQAAEYSGTYGTNGYHLLDFANESTVGHDSSGNNNDFTANNFTATVADTSLLPASPSYGHGSSTNQTWQNSTTSSATPPALGPDYIYWVDLGSSKSFNKVTFDVVASGQSSNTNGNFIVYFSTAHDSLGTNMCNNCTVVVNAVTSGTTPGTIDVEFSGFASQTGRYIGITNGNGGAGGTYTYTNFDVSVAGVPSALDVLFDVPTNGTQSDTGAGGEVSGNYATLNPLLSGSTHTLSNGNLDVSMSGSSQHTTAGTIGVSSGKWYWEMTVNAVSSTYYPGVGIDTNPVGSVQSGSTATGLMYLKSGAKFTSGNLAAYGATYDVGDVIGVALDMDGGTLTFYKNGSSQGQAFSSISGTVFPVVTGTLNGTPGASFNFGQRAWAYSAPSNHKALCTTNLPTPTIADGSDYFDVVLRTSDTSQSKSVTGLAFSPDLIWEKPRSSGSHYLQDTVRGTTKSIISNSTAAETTYSTYITSSNSDGYTIGTGDFTSGTSIVGWTWDAGSSTASNTDGSITTQVRASQSSGFSIVSFTGTGANSSIGHGLNAVPEFIIMKDRDASTGFPVWGPGFSANEFISFTTLVKTSTDGSNYFPSAPTSSVVNLGPWTSPNGNDMIAYCFAPVAGFSAMGEFDATQPFVYLGFAPKFLMLKDIDVAEDWCIYDSVRFPNNPNDTRLEANTNEAEVSASTIEIDFLSNGFKVVGGGSTINGHVIYIAFASHPFQANGGLAR